MNLEKSPFKMLREATGMNGQEFTTRAGIARTSTVYLDAGLMLMPRAVDFLYSVLGTEKALRLLEEQYEARALDMATTLWQRKVRASHADALQQAWDESDPEDERSPVDVLAAIAFGNRDAFCKAMKVPTGALKLYLESSTRPLPPTLREAFYDGGYNPAMVNTLEQEVAEWRDAHLVGTGD